MPDTIVCCSGCGRDVACGSQPGRAELVFCKFCTMQGVPHVSEARSRIGKHLPSSDLTHESHEDDFDGTDLEWSRRGKIQVHIWVTDTDGFIKLRPFLQTA